MFGKSSFLDLESAFVSQSKSTELCSSAAVVRPQSKFTELCSSAAVGPQSKFTEM